jgi:hypothetical protein
MGFSKQDQIYLSWPWSFIGMFAIAGIVCLDSRESLTKEMLRPTLEAMKVAVSCSSETYTMVENTVVIGKVVYGSRTQSEQKDDKVIKKPRAFCIGELYNDEVSQASSTERFLLERYLQHGVENFTTGLNGSFTAVIADPPDDSVTLVTDHMDSRPLYTMIHNGKLYFASEVKGLAAVFELPCEADVSSVLSLAVRGFFLRHRTLMKDVQQMDYATVCHVRHGRVRSWPYWRYVIEPSPDKGYRNYLEEFANLLRQAVNRRVSGGRVAVMLSGGIDSRGISCCLDEPSKIAAVTYAGRTRETRHKLGDWALAELIAKQLGMDLSIIHYDGRKFAQAMQESVYASDGAAGFVFENIWADIREATGAEYLLAGDECMGWTTGPMSDAQVLPSIGVYSLQSLKELQDCMRQDRLDSFVELSLRDIEAINQSCRGQTPIDRTDQFYFEQRVIHFVLPKRRITARHGMLVRNPWLDLDLLNFVRKLPRRHRTGKSLFRRTVSHINPSLSKLPRARAPETINYQSYLSKAERQHRAVSKMVFEDNPLLEEFFDIPSVRRLIQKVCLAGDVPTPPQRFDPMILLPMSVRLKLRAYVLRLINLQPKLSGAVLVLRIAMVATALRHLTNRCRSKL